MARILFTIAIFFSSYPILAQKCMLKGFVYNDNFNTPISKAQIHIDEINYSTITNLEGYFQIRGILPGYYDIKIALIGFGDTTITKCKLDTASTKELSINLFECNYQLGGYSDCPICNNKIQSIPILYYKPTRKQLKEVEKGNIYISNSPPNHCRYKYYCKKDKLCY